MPRSWLRRHGASTDEKHHELAALHELPPTRTRPYGQKALSLVGIEACASSHHWSRELQALGHTVRLMPPAYVKPYVKRHKNDATDKGSKRITVGEDKAYDTSDHIAALRRMNVTPHVAQNDSLTKTGKRRRSAIDARTTRHIGYQISQTCRKMAECIFGWGKQHGTMRKTKHRGIAAVAADFMLNLIAYNLVRIPKLIAA